MSLLGAVLTFALPETRGRKLPVCIAHVEAWTSNIARDNREQMELTNNNQIEYAKGMSKILAVSGPDKADA